jgi:hypothetical protein
MPTGPANDKSPAHPDFDPIWSRLSEAGVAVAYPSRSELRIAHPRVRRPLQARRTRQTAWQWMFCWRDPGAMVWPTSVPNLFDALNIRIVSAENGANWLQFLDKMDKMRGMARTDTGRAGS